MFSWIKRRWKEANGLNTHPFGGLLVILVILVGDVAQLPPVTDQVLHQNKPKKWHGCWELLKFQTVVKLHENVRAEGNDSKQNLFRQLQMWVRDGHSSLEDWELLLSRNPIKVENLQNFENCSVKLSFGNEKVARDLPIIQGI